MKETRIARIAYFIGMSSVAAMVTGRRISGDDAESILGSIERTVRMAKVDAYQLENVSLAEVRQVMGLINPNWR